MDEETKVKDNLVYKSVRESVMDRIDPVEAFNAWNLSMVCGP